MPCVRLLDVGFAYPARPPLFSSLNLRFDTGWTALVGPNGAGKSTALELISGAVPPTRGRVLLQPSGARVALCRQAPDKRPKAVTDFSQRVDGPAQRARSLWGLEPSNLARWATLSRGERQRWQVAAALHDEADVLLLDEPVNHLDVEAREQLSAMLRRFRGIGVVVAHDSAFLEALAPRTVWLEDGEARTFETAYGEVRVQRNTEHHAQVTRATLRAKRAKRDAAELQSRRETLARAEAKRSSRRHMKNAKDADARSSANKGRRDRAAATHAQRTASASTRAAWSSEASHSARVAPRLGGAVRFPEHVDAARARAVRLTLSEILAGGRTLLEATSLVVEPRARVWVSGRNGAGKSSLLRALLERWPERAPVFHLPQELDRDGRARARARLNGLPRQSRGRALTCLAALGTEPTRALRSPCPSPGEARKMLLAEALAGPPTALLLDEPTHHLDLPSVERLTEALRSFQGALLLVTHDRALAEATTDQVWRITDGQLHRGGAR